MQLEECLWMDVYILKVAGSINLYSSGELERALGRQIESGNRLFIVDLRDAPYADTSGLGAIVVSFARIRKRTGRIIWVAPRRQLSEAFKITKIRSILEFANSIPEALTALLGRPIETEPLLIFRPVDSADSIPRKMSEDIQKVSVQEVHQQTYPNMKRSEGKARGAILSTGQRLPSGALLGATAAAVLVFLATIVALVWAAKEISSVLILTLVLGVSIIFEVNLAVFILVATGSLGEKTAQRIMGTTLSKVPGLKLWLPRAGKDDSHVSSGSA